MFSDENIEEKNKKFSKNDKISISILFFLYILQGIPLGLTDSTKLLLQNKKVSYTDQGTFSIADWPFSIKLLWAPIVDSIYFKALGRRKSWLIPAQTLIGLSLLILSSSISELLGGDDGFPNIFVLTVVYFGLNFLAATQDIAVDGWALTMLTRQNVGYASVCNTVGQRVGYFIGNTAFIVLESPDFCNQYLRQIPQPYGIVTLSGFLKISGVIFIVSTLIILIFKHEEKAHYSKIYGVLETYSQLYHILCLKNVIILVFLLLTCQISFATIGSVSKLKFIEAGVAKETMALLEIPKFFIQIIFPIYISSYIICTKPLQVFLKAYPYKSMFGLIFAFFIWWSQYIKTASGYLPTYYYFIISSTFVLHQAIAICVSLPLSSFFNKVSDPSIGATYMTLLNTCYNLGVSLTVTLALWGVDVFTFRKCSNSMYQCNAVNLEKSCENAGYICSTVLDGYYFETVVFAMFSFIWLRWNRNNVYNLQVSSISEWKTLKSKQTHTLEA